MVYLTDDRLKTGKPQKDFSDFFSSDLDSVPTIESLEEQNSEKKSEVSHFSDIPEFLIYHFLDFLGGAPTSTCHFFCLSVHRFVCPSVMQHISGTLHHLIIIFGTLM